MANSVSHWFDRGPFRADQVREGERYELSNGNPIYCAPGGHEHAGKNLIGGAVISSDPAVKWAGVDAGYASEAGTLRAPDIAVDVPSDKPGWCEGAPPLAVEWAGVGQEEEPLRQKIADLLKAGTKLIWVVRLLGPRRVEVHEPGKPLRIVPYDGELSAPGILQNAIPVAALFDREAAHKATLRNLLQRAGYQSLDEVREEGREEALRQGARDLCEVLGIKLTPEREAAIAAMNASALADLCAHLKRDRRWP
jgi:Uma2 family endonuclease